MFKDQEFKPYLNLQERISQVWFNKYTILLIIMVVKVYLFKKSLISSLQTAEIYTDLVCNSLSQYSSTLSSLPTSMTQLTNKLITRTINETNKGILESLELLVTGVEEVILFTIDLVIGTYVCILTATIDASVDVAKNATESVISVANKTVISLADDIQDGLDALQTVVNKIIKLANKVASLFGNTSDKFDQINLTINDLKNWKIDDSINVKLDDLADKVPDFAQVKNLTESILDVPLNKIRNEINSSDYQILHDTELKTIQTSSIDQDFCSTLDFYLKLKNRIELDTKIVIYVLLIIAILILGPLIWLEFKRWVLLRRLNEDNSKDTIEKLQIHDNRYSELIAVYLSKFVSSDNQVKIRWLLLYILSHESLILLLLGLSGIIIVISQYLILKSIMNLSSSLLVEVVDIDKNLSKTINQWTSDTNSIIYDKQEEINDNLFSWVHDSTTSINSTINGFLDNMDNAILLVFNNTPLYNYVQDIAGCVIENKLHKLEEGLTWVHDHSEITFPLLEDSMLSDVLNNNTTSPVSRVGSSLKSALQKILKEYENSTKLELYISLILILIWFLQILIAIIILLIKTRSKKMNLNFVQYEISSPTRLSPTQQDFLTNKFGKLSKVTSPENELIDHTLQHILREDELKYGNNNTDSGISEILSYVNEQDITEQRLSKRWML